MLIWGCRARHSATTSPRNPSPSVTGAVTRSRPAVSSELVERARPASRIVPSAGLQACRYVLPALVSSTRRVVRWRRRVPSARSSSLIRRLTVERGTPSASAAPRKLRSSATRTKSSTAPTSIVPCMGHIVPRAPGCPRDIGWNMTAGERSRNMAQELTVVATGATGKQGGAVARGLLERGHKVRAVTRDPGSSQAKSLANAGATIVAASLEDTAALAKALDGATSLFAMTTPFGGGTEAEIRQGVAAADA